MTDTDMQKCRLVNWGSLPSGKITSVFPDAKRLGEMEVDFGSTMMSVYRYRDGVGNEAFAFEKSTSAASHGSQILRTETISELRKAGAEIMGG